MLRATFGCPDWQHWLAFLGGKAVAAAITHLHEHVGWIGWVSTLPQYRGRGAQRAITCAQLEGAIESRATWITLEVAPGPKNHPSASFRNYQRLGWLTAYDRAVYVRKAVIAK
jgi:hypothetical protein